MSTNVVTVTEQHGKEIHTETHTERHVDLMFGAYVAIAFCAVVVIGKIVKWLRGAK